VDLNATGAAINTATADRIGKLLRLLSSDRDGEIVACVHALRRTLASAGISLDDLANRLLAPAPTIVAQRKTPRRKSRKRKPKPQPRPAPVDEEARQWDALLRACVDIVLHDRHLLSDREAQFITSMREWRGPPTSRQRWWAEDIFSRVWPARRQSA
jgi:hypothetical protein